MPSGRLWCFNVSILPKRTMLKHRGPLLYYEYSKGAYNITNHVYAVWDRKKRICVTLVRLKFLESFADSLFCYDLSSFSMNSFSNSYVRKRRKIQTFKTNSFGHACLQSLQSLLMPFYYMMKFFMNFINCFSQKGLWRIKFSLWGDVFSIDTLWMLIKLYISKED